MVLSVNLLFWVAPQPWKYSPSTSDHETSSSIINIINLVDQLLRSERVVHYRGHGYSNRFDTLQRLYIFPTPRNSWPRAPIRVDQRCSDKTCLTRDSFIVPPALFLPRRSALGGPCVLMTPATVVATTQTGSNCPKRGRAHKLNNNWAHKVIAAYRAVVARRA